MIRIVIVDDHAIFRAGLKQVLSDERDIRVVAEAGTAREAIQIAKQTDADVLLLDIAMPDQTGLEVLHSVKQERPSLPILILSTYPEYQYGIRMLKGGAAGYLTKESAPDQLVVAVRKVVAGGRYVSTGLAEELAARLCTEEQDKPRHDRLSNREFQTFCMIAKGKTSAEIAQELAVSIKTVATYRARILEKMGITRIADIVNYALRHRLLD